MTDDHGAPPAQAPTEPAAHAPGDAADRAGGDGHDQDRRAPGPGDTDTGATAIGFSPAGDGGAAPAESADFPVFVSAPAQSPSEVSGAEAQPETSVADEFRDDTPLFPQIYGWVKRFLERHANKMWWMHSLWAMSLGTFVVLYAQKGYDHARWLTVSMGVGWIVLLLFFRVYGTGDAQRERMETGTRARVSFYVMTYVLKNLYQGMLFFLLPFYWRTAVFDADNRYAVVLLAVLAICSTLDVVFDRYLMRWKAGASILYFIILFACLNLIIPALLPDTRALISLMLAAAVAAVVFWSMHMPFRALLKPTTLIAFMLTVATSVGLAYFARRAIPPVPMHVVSGAVGPSLLEDGRLTMEVSRLHETLIQEMHALTDVVTPGGHGDDLYHVWRHRGLEVQRGHVEPSGDPPKGTVRLRSTLKAFNLPPDISGPWSVDVVTADDQLIGRVDFDVIK